MKYLFLLFILTSLGLAQDCTPFGVRLQYGEGLLTASSPEKMVVYFNTDEPCTNSFIRILGKTGFNQVECQSEEIVASDRMDFFTTYVQKCSVTSEIQYS